MDEQLERIEREAQVALHSDNDRSMFKFYLRRMYAREKTLDQLASADGQLVAIGFMEMMA